MHERVSERFAALDLLRGIAALSVCLYHSPPPAMHVPVPRAYLAVDLFFVLSGFVIAHAYQERLATARQFGQFCIARLIRVYPLYLAAVLITAAAMLFSSILGANDVPPIRATLGLLAPALLLLPVPPGWSVRPQFVFPLVITSWSLFWELWVNFLYGIVAPHLRRPVLAALIALGAVGVAIVLWDQGNIDAGWRWPWAWGGAPRALFSFFTGVAIFRFRKIRRAPRVPSLLLAGLLLLLFVPEQFGGRAYDAVCVFLLLPLIVWFGAETAEGETMRSVGLFAGYLSYPVYLLQVPVQFALQPIQVRLAKFMPSTGLPELLLYVGATVLLSWVVARWFDSPVRHRLRRRFARRAPRPAAQTAP